MSPWKRGLISLKKNMRIIIELRENPTGFELTKLFEKIKELFLTYNVFVKDITIEKDD